MIMEYLSIPYEMVTYNQDTSQKWFKEIKPELIKKNPAVTLPYLIDGDKVITESNATCVYLVHKGNRADLTGRNAEEKGDGIIQGRIEAYRIYSDSLQV